MLLFIFTKAIFYCSIFLLSCHPPNQTPYEKTKTFLPFNFFIPNPIFYPYFFNPYKHSKHLKYFSNRNPCSDILVFGLLLKMQIQKEKKNEKKRNKDVSSGGSALMSKQSQDHSKLEKKIIIYKFYKILWFFLPLIKNCDHPKIF